MGTEGALYQVDSPADDAVVVGREVQDLEVTMKSPLRNIVALTVVTLAAIGGPVSA
jgi:hypothetical protein